MSKMSAKQGESTSLVVITIEGLTDYTDYYGNLRVLEGDTDDIVLGPIRVDPADSKFSVAFNPAQTLGLPIEDYTVVFEVVKEVADVIEFRKEVSWPLKINKAIIDYSN